MSIITLPVLRTRASGVQLNIKYVKVTHSLLYCPVNRTKQPHSKRDTPESAEILNIAVRQLTAQNIDEFAQNLDMCTPKLEKSGIFTIFTFLLHAPTTLCDTLNIFCAFSW